MSKKRDPYAKRERQRYENPIPSREFIIEIIREHEALLTFSQIASSLELDDEQLQPLKKRLGAMCRDGQLMTDRKGRYGLIKKMDLLSGEVSAHRDGFGFLLCDQGGKDLFLSASEMLSLFHGDRVLVRVSGGDGSRSEARVVEVLERAVTNVVGQLCFSDGVYYVIPEHRRITKEIVIPQENLQNAKPGQVVACVITHYPERRAPAVGIIEKILGNYFDPGLEIEMAITNYGIPNTWSADLKRELAKIPKTVRKNDCQDREDLRALPLVTIDGEDARDFDDAVFCEQTKAGWRMIVAIADVSHYVMPDTKLDQEGKDRGNSVYFPGSVVPMLPEKLSNGICSLKPQVDRLCLACEVHFDQTGARKDYRFFPAVMHSHARLTYTGVGGIIDETDYTSIEKYSAVLPALYNLQALYELLLAKRKDRGALEFASTETKIVFGSKKKIDYITTVERNVAHRIIEECMLAANVAASDFAKRHKLPILYRNHEPPNPEKLTALREFLREFNLGLRGGDSPSPLNYAELTEEIIDRPEQHMLSLVVLRSLSQAVYAPANIGHFGLAYESYTHFTSPIRRYPDLLLHRAIKAQLQQQPEQLLSSSELAVFGDHCSHTERRADEATRDVEAWLKCEYMSDRIGETFNGMVVSVTSFGLFVELTDVYIEGLIHVSSLTNDYYHFDKVRHTLTGEHTGKSFRIGDSIEVVVTAVNLDDRKIDLVLADSDEAPVRPRRKRRKKRDKD